MTTPHLSRAALDQLVDSLVAQSTVDTRWVDPETNSLECVIDHERYVVTITPATQHSTRASDEHRVKISRDDAHAIARVLDDSLNRKLVREALELSTQNVIAADLVARKLELSRSDVEIRVEIDERGTIE